MIIYVFKIRLNKIFKYNNSSRSTVACYFDTFQRPVIFVLKGYHVSTLCIIDVMDDWNVERCKEYFSSLGVTMPRALKKVRIIFFYATFLLNRFQPNDEASSDEDENAEVSLYLIVSRAVLRDARSNGDRYK